MKKLLPVTLTAQQGNWNRYQARNRNQRFQVIAKRIFLRDSYRCQFCGFQDEKYNYVINIDNDYNNNKSHNMVTACPFCTQCFFLDAVGNYPSTGGYVIYLPEISQADLNNFCRILFSSMLKDVPYRSKLNNTYLSFRDRTKMVEEIFGANSSQPATFGQSLIDSHLTPEQRQHPALEDLRLLPSFKAFHTEVTYWKETIFRNIPL